MAKTQYVCMSNTIILDRRLKPSAVRVMSALLRFRRSNGTASVTLERLAAAHMMEEQEIKAKLEQIGYQYDAEQNRFV